MSRALTSDSQRRTREIFREVIDLYRGGGMVEEAERCIRLAVDLGLWGNPAQRPLDYVAGVTAKPVYNASTVDVCAYLEANFDAILEDREAMEVPGDAFFPVEEPLVQSGEWTEVLFYEGGRRYDSAARRFPNVARVVDGLPQIVQRSGVVMLSRLAPGTHIIPHCGFTNSRLRVHLGILTPKDALMRVGNAYVEWTEGKCVVFDDSFEHEVWHFGKSPRVVLLLDVPHPEIADAESRFAASGNSLEAEIDQFMRKRGLRRIARESDAKGEVRAQFDRFHEKLIVRLMSELGVSTCSVEERDV